MEIKRSELIHLIVERFKTARTVAILGPRQCGKSTLARQFTKGIKGQVHTFDLENPQDLAQLENPVLALQDLGGLIVIDEIQRLPELFPILRVLIDRNKKTRYLVLGSASRDLIRQSSETLAGRISYLEMGGFSLDEISNQRSFDLWMRGGFPLSFLAKNSQLSAQWLDDFITTFLERDIPNLGFRIHPRTLRKFWIMVSHYHGRLLNASEIGKSLNLSHNTVRKYIDILSGTFMVRQVQPWFYNTKKRLIKSPKIYIRDTGILHRLASIDSKRALLSHPMLGSSWESFALEQVIRLLQLKDEDVFFWGVHSGAEIELIFKRKGKLYGIEAKYQDAPRLTASIHSALKELSLQHVWITYPGSKSYALRNNVSVVSLRDLSSIR